MQRKTLKSIKSKIAQPSNISDFHLAPNDANSTRQELISRLTSQIDSLYEKARPLTISKMTNLLQEVE